MLDWNKQGAESGPGVLAPAATGAARLIERYGGDVDRIFGRVGIPPEIIDNPIQSLSLGAFCGLFEEAAVPLDQPADRRRPQLSRLIGKIKGGGTFAA